MKIEVFVLTILLSAGLLSAQPARKAGQASRIYTIGIEEVHDNLGVMYDLNQAMEEERLRSGNRGLGAVLFSTYRALAADKVGSMMNTSIDMGISFVYNALRSHRTDWMKAVEKESMFTKVINMTEDVSDFYMEPSTEGALDLNNIAFRGFSCGQHIRTEGKSEGPEVFNIEFQLDTTKEGISRMLQHSKFQMKVKSIRFNPYLCEIPNDSTFNEEHRIPFSFERRKDLKVKLHTVIKSSWINEAVLLSKDQVLGEFDLEFTVDPAMMKDSCFTYDCTVPEDSVKLKHINLKGESFIVPRSYIGKIDGTRYWGTGQYRLEMTLSESCRLNEAAYMTVTKDGDTKWNKEIWQSEWKIIRKRQKDTKGKEALKKSMDKITMTWKDGRWITEIVSPCTNILIKEGTSYIRQDRP